MNRLTAAELAELLQAELVPGTDAREPSDAPADLADLLVGPEVVIDARQASPGSLFVAIPGERVDGHDFTAQAAANGAVAAIVTRPTAAPLAHLVVDDTIAGLSRLARALVDRGRSQGLTTLAVTGSSGKTSTKDLLAQVLEAAGPTTSPVGSFNNEIGVPLTACGIDDQTRFLVSEMGARGIGHIDWLCQVTPPQVAMVLNIGHAHIGEFGSREGIARAKGEIVEALPPTGWAVLNADDPLVAAMASRVPGGAGQVVWFTQAEPPADAQRWVRAVDVRADALQRHQFLLQVGGSGGRFAEHPVDLQVLGAHQVANALAAAAAAVAAGLDAGLVADALSRATTRSHWRMELTERFDGAAILNDAYNANPDSMAAALQTLAEIATARRREHPGARAIAVLGDMLELGPDAEALHRELGERAVACGVDELVCVGDFAETIAAGARNAGLAAARAMPRDQVAGSLALGGADVVLVKASRGIALETVAEELVAGLPAGSASAGVGRSTVEQSGAQR